MALESNYIWHQGKLVAFADAQVHFLTSSLHYGTAVFEGIRAYQTENGVAVFRLKDHIKRLCDSAKIIGLNVLPYSEQTMYDACLEVIAANNFADCYIRPLIYIKNGAFNLVFTNLELDFSVAAWSWDKYMGEEALKHGIRAKISSFARPHANTAMLKAKVTGHYINSSLAKTEVISLGFDEAIMLDVNGFVSECSGQNLYVYRKGRLYSPSSETVLEGITRESVALLAKDLGFDVSEATLTRDQLYIADEVFMVGTANEVIAIREIDGRKIGNGSMGKVCASLQTAYTDLIRGKNNKYVHFLDYVPSKITETCEV